MALSTEQLERFNRDGFILVEDLFTRAEVARMKSEIQKVLERVGRTRPKIAQAGVYVGITAACPWFRQVHRDARVADVLAQIIGPGVEFWSDKIVFKSADTNFGSPWHQDWMYWKGAHKYSMWLALDDATPQNGCLKFMPGSHHEVADHGGEGDGHGFVNRLADGAVDESKAVTVPVAAGGAAFFHDLALHASLPNTSGRDRWALISTYRDASADDYEYDYATAAFMVRGRRTGRVLEQTAMGV